MKIYPNCSVLLMKYVQTELLPHFRWNKEFERNDEIDAWDEQVEYFDGIDKPLHEHDINLVYYFAFWTQTLRETYPDYMQILISDVAHENSISEYAENSNFSVEYRKTKVNLTFTVLVIRAMLLKARSVLAESLQDLSESAVDKGLLDWMEELLSMFQDELHVETRNEQRLSILLDKLHGLSGYE
jgi:hypothetical protein